MRKLLPCERLSLDTIHLDDRRRPSTDLCWTGETRGLRRLVADFELLRERYRTADNAHPAVWAAEGVWAAQRGDRMAKRSGGLNCVAAFG